MRILVASIFEASSQKAYVINTVKMAQGFARLGHEVTIVCYRPPTGRVSDESLAQIYGITEPLRWIQLNHRFFGALINPYRWFSLLAAPVVLQLQPDLIYARNDEFPALSVASKYGIATVAESHAHAGTDTPDFRRLVALTRYSAFLGWVTISHRLADYYHSLGVAKDKLIVLPDAVDLRFFQRPDTLPPSPYRSDRPNVAYVGHLYDYKGIPTILEAAAKLPEVNFHLVGGFPQDIKLQQQRAKALQLENVTFHGLKPQVEVPKFLWHADVLLLPPSQHHPSAAWTSPVKLGEYLASGTPVVATDILALRDWLSDREVQFVAPDSPEALAAGIEHLLSNGERSAQLRVNGLTKAEELSYEKRAGAILSFAGYLSNSNN